MAYRVYSAWGYGSVKFKVMDFRIYRVEHEF